MTKVAVAANDHVGGVSEDSSGTATNFSPDYTPAVIGTATYNNSEWLQWYEKYGQYYYASANYGYDYNNSYYHYPGSEADKPLARSLQKPTVQRVTKPPKDIDPNDPNFKCIVDYGYPTPPKPPKLPVPSPLVSPCVSDDEDVDDANLIDLDADIEDEIDKCQSGINSINLELRARNGARESISNEERLSDSPVVLDPPPLPPEFPWDALPVPPEPPKFPWPVVPLPPKRDKYAKFRNQEEELPWMIDGVHPALPKQLLQLMKPMHCHLCNIELSSKVVSLDHYRGKRHRLNVNFWLRRNKFPMADSYPTPPSWKRRRVEYTQKKQVVIPPAPKVPAFNWSDMSDSRLPPAVKSLCGLLACSLCEVKHFSATHAEEHYRGLMHRARVDKWLWDNNFVPNILHRPQGPSTMALLPVPQRPGVFAANAPPRPPPLMSLPLQEGQMPLNQLSLQSRSMHRKPPQLRSYWSWIRRNKVGFFAHRGTNAGWGQRRVRRMSPEGSPYYEPPYYEAAIFRERRF